MKVPKPSASIWNWWKQLTVAARPQYISERGNAEDLLQCGSSRVSLKAKTHVAMVSGGRLPRVGIGKSRPL